MHMTFISQSAAGPPPSLRRKCGRHGAVYDSEIVLPNVGQRGEGGALARKSEKPRSPRGARIPRIGGVN